MRSLIVLLTVGGLTANLADLITTIVGISFFGAQETNALFAPIYEVNVPLAAAIKLIPVSILLTLPAVIYYQKVVRIPLPKVKTFVKMLLQGALIYVNLCFWMCAANNIIVMGRLI